MRRSILLSAILLIAAAAGCAQGPISSAVRGTRTSGWTLDLLRRAGDGAAAWYRLTGEGNLQFGGGFAALRAEPTWTGPLTDQEVAELVAMLERLDWFGQPPEGSGEPADLHWTVTVSGPPGRRRFRLTGHEEGIAEVEALLDRAARRRHDDVLDGLPRPSGTSPASG